MWLLISIMFLLIFFTCWCIHISLSMSMCYKLFILPWCPHKTCTSSFFPSLFILVHVNIICFSTARNVEFFPEYTLFVYYRVDSLPNLMSFLPLYHLNPAHILCLPSLFSANHLLFIFDSSLVHLKCLETEMSMWAHMFYPTKRNISDQQNAQEKRK